MVSESVGIGVFLRDLLGTIPVTMSSSRESYIGRLSFPQTGSLLPFQASSLYGELESPGDQTPLVVEYEAKGRFRFQTHFVREDRYRRWLITPPSVIKCADRRKSKRHMLTGMTGFVLWVHGEPYQLRDLSPQGLSFYMGQNGLRVETGILMMGDLEVPIAGRIPLMLQVTNVRGNPLEVGARFVELPSSDSWRLELALSYSEAARRRTHVALL